MSEKTISAEVTTDIYGTPNAWSLAPTPGSSAVTCGVKLEIRGTESDGFHLIMQPDGFSPADYWYESERAALDTAGELFGVEESAWTTDGSQR